jgi:TolA-binding protein
VLTRLIRIFTVLIVIVLSLLNTNVSAQNKYANANVDSAAIKKRIDAEYARRDSILAAARQKRIDDSIARVIQKQKIQEYRDSLFNARKAKKTADSLERIAAKLKLENERRIADSIASANKKRIQDSLAVENEKLLAKRAEEKRVSDSIALANKLKQDSIAFARKKINDSIQAVRDEEMRLRAELAKYKNSKHYKDSVEARTAFVKDSIKNARNLALELQKNERQRVNDSLKTARQQFNDSINAVRQTYNDSVKLAQKEQLEKSKQERQRIADSLLTAREKRLDSLQTARKKSQKEKEVVQEKEKKKKEISLAIKLHEKKKEEWSNEKLLKRKWSWPRRVYQNTVTRYNYYYNAKRKYDEGIRTMTKTYKEDYNAPIRLEPFDVKKQGSTVAALMDTVIKKSSFSTQIHDPRSKWFDNLYFLMGKASFVKNDFDGAITTFQFIANEYKDNKKKSGGKTQKNDPQSIATIENRKGLKRFSHQPIRNDALVWLAKSYIMAEQYSEAQSLLGTLAKDKSFPNRKKAELFITKALLDIEQENQADAIESINQALKQKMSDKLRNRLEFLVGQLYAEQKEYAKSTDHLKKSLSKKSTPEMDFFTKLKIAENAANGGGDKATAISLLQKIINDPKYAKYKSQALNALALIEKENNVENAIAHLKKSIENPENKDNKQKAIAFANLGDIYYGLSNYEKSKVAYDSASFLGTNPPIDNLSEVNIRKEVLTEIVKNIRSIREQDSMLLLATKSDKEQKAAAKRELAKAKAAEEAQAPGAGNGQVVALQPNSPVKSNWYFYNNANIQKGSTEFKQKWGNRKLEDNWRRQSSTNSSYVSGDDDKDSSEVDGAPEGKFDSKSISALLAKLPKTPAEVDKANNLITDAYYNLGLIYYSKLEDYLKSIDMFDTLVYRFPKTTYKKQAYYGLYLDYDKLGNKPKADYYKGLLQTEFPSTDFALRANNPNYNAEQAKKASEIFEHYDLTYAMYKEGKYKEAIDRSLFAYNNYKANPLIPKYQLVEAISLAGLKDFDSSKAILQSVIKSYPNSSEQQRAQEILALMVNQEMAVKKDSQGTSLNVVNAGNSNSQDSLEASEAFKELREADGKGVYSYDPSFEHKVLIFVKNVDGRTMGLKSALSDYNLLKHNVKEYTTNLNLLTTKQAVLSIELFSNSVFAKQYAIVLNEEKLIFSQFKKMEYEIAIISVPNFTELLKTRDVLGYLRFYKKNYK